MGTMIVGIILCTAVAFIVRDIIKKKKSGQSCNCGSDCGHCNGGCH